MRYCAFETPTYNRIIALPCVKGLSKSVADAISMEKNDELRETERFVTIMNKFFDYLNVRCTTKTRNPDL